MRTLEQVRDALLDSIRIFGEHDSDRMPDGGGTYCGREHPQILDRLRLALEALDETGLVPMRNPVEVVIEVRETAELGLHVRALGKHGEIGLPVNGQRPRIRSGERIGGPGDALPWRIGPVLIEGSR